METLTSDASSTQKCSMTRSCSPTGTARKATRAFFRTLAIFSTGTSCMDSARMCSKQAPWRATALLTQLPRCGGRLRVNSPRRTPSKSTQGAHRQYLSIYLSIDQSINHPHTHTRTHAHTHARTHTHTHNTQLIRQLVVAGALCLSEHLCDRPVCDTVIASAPLFELCPASDHEYTGRTEGLRFSGWAELAYEAWKRALHLCSLVEGVLEGHGLVGGHMSATVDK